MSLFCLLYIQSGMFTVIYFLDMPATPLPRQLAYKFIIYVTSVLDCFSV